MNPHITIATRYLTNELYHKIWQSFKNRKFIDYFLIDKIVLLKHNTKFWEIYKEFKFE